MNEPRAIVKRRCTLKPVATGTRTIAIVEAPAVGEGERAATWDNPSHPWLRVEVLAVREAAHPVELATTAHEFGGRREPRAAERAGPADVFSSVRRHGEDGRAGMGIAPIPAGVPLAGCRSDRGSI